MPVQVVSSISTGFPELSQSEGQVTHVLLTRSPLITQEQAPKITVRLACVKHAASVRPEPGSNSPLMFQTPTPPKKRSERKNKPRRVKDSSRAERVKLTQFQFNQRKTRSTQQPEGHRNKPRSNLASIFGTLLSSQESDAHQHNTFQHHIGATIQCYLSCPYLPNGRSHHRGRSEDQREVRSRGECPL
jgi:hypothetical protein